MQFTDNQLASFVNLYKQEFNKEISSADALVQAGALISLVRITYQPISKQDFKKHSSLKKNRIADNMEITINKDT